MNGETPTARQRRVWDRNAGSYDKQIAFFERIQFAGGREWREHFTRRQLPLVEAAGFDVVETERRKAGSVERIHARKPAA
jgi:hypothetical protein